MLVTYLLSSTLIVDSIIILFNLMIDTFISLLMYFFSSFWLYCYLQFLIFRTCPRLHPCKQYCYEKCDDCKILVERTLNCGHEKNLPCYIDENRYLCDTEQEDISPLCKHKVLRKCHEKVEDAQCFTKCSDRLDCGHVCEQLCHKKYDPDHLFVRIALLVYYLSIKLNEWHRYNTYTYIYNDIYFSSSVENHALNWMKIVRKTTFVKNCVLKHAENVA